MDAARAPAVRPMTPLDAALGFAARGWRVFPCNPRGPRRKQPLTSNGFRDASTNRAILTGWWCRWPDALIGVATGRVSGFFVLDVDVKYADANGFDTLDALGFAILPNTPMAHTASGGLHLYFAPPADVQIACTEGEKGRGIGRGLDWRGSGGYVIGPSPGSGYAWDPHWEIDTIALAPVPNELLPREHERLSTTRPVKPAIGLSAHAEAALDNACRRIIGALDGEQETTINGEAFSIGTLAGASAIPADFARRALIWAAQQIRDYDRRRPWRSAEIENKVVRAFDAGMRHPREKRRA